MKTQFFLLLLFLSATLAAQNWQLFPNNQRSYFTNDDITLNLEIAIVDSFSDDGDSQYYRFDGSDYFVNAHECYEEILLAQEEGMLYCETTTGNYFPFIDSIEVVDDKAWIHSDEIAYPMYFLPYSLEGDEWNLLPPGYEHIVIRCTGIAEETFCGITDSVKTFRFFYDDGVSILEAGEIRLSKHYGLVEFIDFNFLGNYDGTGTVPVYTMEGMTDDIMQKGFYLKDYEAYFVYDAGDVLIWEIDHAYYEPMYHDYIEYYKDSILSKEVYADSIVFHIDGTKKDTAGELTYYADQRIVYRRAGFDPLLQSPVSGVSVGNNSHGNYGIDRHAIWCNMYVTINTDIDTTIQREFLSGVNNVDLSDCYVEFIFDLSSSFNMKTGIGVTEYSRGDSGGITTWTLIGYSINGVTWGDMDFDGLAINDQTQTAIEFYPNPATNTLYVKSQLNTRNFTYSIYDLNGILMQTSSSFSDQIDISQLHTGIYFIEIEHDDEIGRGTFLKL